MTTKQAASLQAFAVERSGDPRLDAIKEAVVKALVRERLKASA